MEPSSSTTSTSTVGLPRLSRISRAMMSTISVMLVPWAFGSAGPLSSFGDAGNLGRVDFRCGVAAFRDRGRGDEDADGREEGCGGRGHPEPARRDERALQ